MRILLEAVSASREPNIACVHFHSMSAIVGQAMLAALLARLPPKALAGVRESYPRDEKLGGAGELLVTITLSGEMPAWAMEIYAP